MTLDDTELDQLAAQVRANPPLPLAEVERLLAAARRAGGGGDALTVLATHHMDHALHAALTHHAREDDVAELFQEAGIAVVTAVAEYAAGDGHASGLGPAVRTAAEAHVDLVRERERTAREETEAFVRDTRLLDLAQVAMARKLGRPATPAELAEPLNWTPTRVELVAGILDAARRDNDESLIPFLDDEDEDAIGEG